MKLGCFSQYSHCIWFRPPQFESKHMGNVLYHIRILFFLVSWAGLRLSPLGTLTTTGLLYQLRVIDDECEAVGGMRIGRRNRNTRRKPAPVPLCPPQIPHYLTWSGTRAAAVVSRRLTA
jgi:hypothetical protein